MTKSNVLSMESEAILTWVEIPFGMMKVSLTEIDAPGTLLEEKLTSLDRFPAGLEGRQTSARH